MYAAHGLDVDSILIKRWKEFRSKKDATAGARQGPRKNTDRTMEVLPSALFNREFVI